MEQTRIANISEARVRQAPGKLTRLRWAAARLLFIGTVSLSLGTVVAGIPAAPLISWWMFGDWRFWRHLRRGLGLYAYGYRMLGLMLRGDGSFLLGVPLTSPPRSTPLPGVVVLSSEWTHGTSCGPCNRCCRHGARAACPLLDLSSGLCVGYDSFFWRYFNCGRFPTRQWDLDYYGCPKWDLAPPAAEAVVAFPQTRPKVAAVVGTRMRRLSKTLRRRALL